MSYYQKNGAGATDKFYGLVNADDRNNMDYLGDEESAVTTDPFKMYHRKLLGLKQDTAVSKKRRKVAVQKPRCEWEGVDCDSIPKDAFKVERLETDKDRIRTNPGAKFVGKHPFRTLIAGASGAGKTTLLIHLWNKWWAPYFDEIWLWSPNYELDTNWRQITRKPDRVFTDFKPEQFARLRQQQREGLGQVADEEGRPYDDPGEQKGTADMPTVLVVLDDMIANHQAMNDTNLHTFATLCRHENVSLVMLTQKYNAYAKIVRVNTSMIMVFGTDNDEELEDISNEHAGGVLTRRQFRRMFNSVTFEPNSFLTIMGGGCAPDKRYRRGLADIVDIREFLTKANDQSLVTDKLMSRIN